MKYGLKPHCLTRDFIGEVDQRLNMDLTPFVQPVIISEKLIRDQIRTDTLCPTRYFIGKVDQRSNIDLKPLIQPSCSESKYKS